MSFSFFKASRGKAPLELVKVSRDSLVALDTKIVAEVKAHEKALEEVEKNFLSMRQLLSGGREVEPNLEHVSQFTIEICKKDVIGLFIHKLPLPKKKARKDLVHCWSSILLKQMVGSSYCCIEYRATRLPCCVWCIYANYCDFLNSYDNKDVALNCWNMLRECIKFPSLAK
ncbi:hypothetical protein IFM89_012670 [Coptis chinensis]|uniref:Uncharacterized protein n=1 Tax=Coptis chinensis TaxID=261450 RepID=A0A835H3X3_9MAGN|nr:hypothetical protein IFM89_012670 [Coptis chinensis]